MSLGSRSLTPVTNVLSRTVPLNTMFRDYYKCVFICIFVESIYSKVQYLVFKRLLAAKKARKNSHARIDLSISISFNSPDISFTTSTLLLPTATFLRLRPSYSTHVTGFSWLIQARQALVPFTGMIDGGCA